jgi:hypothetical protein
VLESVVGTATDQGHDGHAGLEPGQTQGQLGKDDHRDRHHSQRAAVAGGHQLPPVHDQLRVGGQVLEGHDDHDKVEGQVDGDEPDRDADGLGEALEEDPAQQRDQEQRDRDLLAVQEAGDQGIFQDVGGGVGGREGDGDDEVGGHEAEQGQDEELASPPRQQPLQHGDRALAVRALGGDAAVDREGAEQGQQDQQDGRDRRQHPGGEGGDAWLVPEGGEVVHPGEAHDLPPGMLVVFGGLLVRPWQLVGLGGEAVQEPAPQACGRDHGWERSVAAAASSLAMAATARRVVRSAGTSRPGMMTR